MKPKITIIGCGAWATTIANHLCQNQIDVVMWAYKKDIVTEINQSHQRSKLPQLVLEKNLTATTSFEVSLDKTTAIILCVPSKFLFTTLELWKPYFNKTIPVLSLIKGIASDTEMLLPHLIEQNLVDVKLAVLSGPNLASEIAFKKPAASVIASKDIEIAKIFQNYLSSSLFRVYTSTDIIGVYCGGIVKNVIALASGCCDGLDLGFNTKATLITRGLNDMIKFGMFMGAKKETFYGLSGLGDMVATAHSPLSRNYQYGLRLAKSQLNTTTKFNFNEIAEGVETTKRLAMFAKKNNINLPIVEIVNDVLNHNLKATEAITILMNRKLKEESL